MLKVVPTYMAVCEECRAEQVVKVPLAVPRTWSDEARRLLKELGWRSQSRGQRKGWRTWCPEHADRPTREEREAVA